MLPEKDEWLSQGFILEIKSLKVQQSFRLSHLIIVESLFAITAADSLQGYASTNFANL